ncbi:MAG: PepSY-like domain-containing protein [Bacteroidales bacterium]|nr:PepSY-like domain-containing protein [Bacteroidales bacterium]MDY6395716.1 PepSY-like domain-containing protein [Bacteroidales bacterium]
MKHFILTAILIGATLSSFAQQKLRKSEVPQEVRMGLENTYTDYKLEGWYFETGQYVANINIDNNTGRVFFTPTGNWQYTIFEIKQQELPTLVDNYFIKNYPGYRIKQSQYIEDMSGDNYYRLIIAMKGIAQTEYEMIFDTRGKLTKTNAPDPDYVKKDYIARLNPEAIEYRQKKMAEREGIEGEGISIDYEKDVAETKKSKKVDVKTPDAVDVPKIPDEVTSAFKKKFPRAEVKQWKQEGENYRATYDRRGLEAELLMQKDGTFISTTTNMEKDRYPRLITKDLALRYPKAKIEKFQKIDFDSKYKKTVTDKKLETYYYIELTEKIKGRDDKKRIKVTYDKSFKFQGLAGSDDEYAEDEE